MDRALDVSSAIGDKHAPARQRLLHAKAQKGHETFEQDHARNEHGEIGSDRPRGIGNDMAPKYDRGARAKRLGGGDKLLLLDRKRSAAHDPRHVEPFDSANRHENEHEMAAEDHDEDDHEKNERKRID